jgi:hypothetical protein
MLGDGLEKPLFKHSHSGDNTGFAASRERMQLNVTWNERSDELGVRRCAGATASNIFANIMDLCGKMFVSYATIQEEYQGNSPSNARLLHLFAVFIRNNRTSGRTCISTEYNPILEKATDDSGTGAGRLWHLHALTLKESISFKSYLSKIPKSIAAYSVPIGICKVKTWSWSVNCSRHESHDTMNEWV